MTDENSTNDELLERAAVGDEAAMVELFGQHRDRLHRMITLRMDQRMRARVDASDVLQDAYVDLAQQLANYAKDPKLPLYLWMRRITGQRLSKLHRNHLGTLKRDASLEISLHSAPQASSFMLASKLVGHFTSAGRNAVRAEMQLKLQEILNSMDANDCEILALRHFEQLDNREIAILLGISEQAANQRHYRAVLRLKDALKRIPGMLD